jgi:hypothetical protein
MKRLEQNYMKKINLAGAALATGILFTGALTPLVHAQSSDAVIDKLVEKGILTVKEANDLKAEADKEFTKAHQAKTGMPDYVNSLKINGDVRGRVESFHGDNSAFADRNRFRYRLRVGMTASLLDNFEAGFRLTSSDPTSDGTGGDPISGNTTFQNNGSKKFLYLDTVYGKWNFLNDRELSGSVTIGKMDNPFTLSDMVYDHDYTPEGASVALNFAPSDKHKLKLVGAGFALDEIGGNSDDPSLIGGQLGWDAAWTPKLSSMLSASAMSIQNRQFLRNADVPNQNRGNTRSADGSPTYGFNPIIGDATLTYSLETFPGYNGAFPIRALGEYMYNPAAPSSADNHAWMAGVMFGKSGKKGTWDVSYRYKWLGANSWYEELTDSDFGAYYQSGAGRNDGVSGTGAGYGAGTNVRGHVMKGSWSPSDSMTLSVTYFLTDLIRPNPANSKSDVGRLQVDALWKF